MKYLFYYLLIFTLPSILTSQSLVLEELDSIPEFPIFTFHQGHDSETYFFRSFSEDNYFYFIENYDSLEKISACPEAPFVFYKYKEDYVCNTGSEFYIFRDRELNEIHTILGNYSYGSHIQAIEENIYISTTNYILRTSNEGVSFDTLHIFNNDQLIRSKSYQGKQYNIIKENSQYRLLVTDINWNTLRMIDLPFESSNFLIQNDIIYFTVSNVGLKYSELENIQFEDILIPNVGQRINVFDNFIITMSNDFRKLQIIEFPNYSFNEIDLTERYFPNINEEILYLVNAKRVLLPKTIVPLEFDTLIPNVIAAKILGLKVTEEALVTLSQNNIYNMSLTENRWNKSTTVDSFGHTSMFQGGKNNIIIATSGTQIQSTDNGKSFQRMINPPTDEVFYFGDTTIYIGNQSCSEFNNAGETRLSMDGGDTWPIEVASPRCFEKRFQTVTKDRVYFYDHDMTYSLSPVDVIYSWFAVYHRKDRRFSMISGDPDIMPFIPGEFGPFSSENVCFYVSPDETIFVHPLKEGISGYHRKLGQSWVETPGVPHGQIYPTADSLATIIIQNDLECGMSPKFFVRFDLDTPYQEISVMPENLPSIDFLKYTSDGRMLLASETGYFYITDGLTSSTDELQEAPSIISIYPNPTDGIVSIETEEDIKGFEVYNLQGQRINSYTQAPQLDISSFPIGVYYLKFRLEKGTITKKLVKY